MLASLQKSLSAATNKVKASVDKAKAVVTNPRGALAEAKKKAEAEAAEKLLISQGVDPKGAKLLKESVAESGGLTEAAGSISSTMTKVKEFFVTNGVVIGVVLGVITLIIFAILYFKRRPKTPDASNTADILNATTSKKKEGFADAAPAADAPAEDFALINLQPLTIKQAGFLGPLPNGRFDAEQAVTQALRSGFRAFVLQIDYLDIKKDQFEEPGYPTLLYRDGTGALISANSGSLEAVAAALASSAFRPEVPAYTTPLVLYLHVARAPSPIRAPKEYVRFLSRIAQALRPLAPMHLGMSALGNFHRQNLEAQLMTTPVKAIEGQVVIMTNADTSIFRTPPSEGERYDPADDLDFWTNARVYLDSEDDTFGITAPVPSDKRGGAAAVIVSLDRVLGMTQSKRDAFAAKGKSRFVIAMPSPMKNPTPNELALAMNELGVNMIPLDIFAEDVTAVKSLVEDYKGSWRPKPVTLRKITT